MRLFGFWLRSIAKLIVIVALLLAGCGFHLRGLVELPPWFNNIAIVVKNSHHDIDSLLKEQLESYKVVVNPNINKASYWVVIEGDSVKQQITSISASTTPRQYLLTYELIFTVVSVNGSVMIPSTAIVITRQFTENNDRILGSRLEESLFATEMRREAILKVLNRLRG